MLALLLTAATLAVATGEAAPPPPLSANVSVVASGFSWIENLCFDGAGGSMFASERLRGQLLAVNGTAGGGYTTTVLLEGMWKLLLGCVVDSTRFPDIVFVVGELLNGSHVLAAVPVRAPSRWAIVALTPHCGNGIRIHEATGLLYTSTEGTFLPGSGAVYEINPSVRPWGGQAKVIGQGLEPADGLWIDQALATLYVGLLPSSKVWTYNLTSRTVLGTFGGLEHNDCELLLCAMDDFTLDRQNSSVIVVRRLFSDMIQDATFQAANSYFGVVVVDHVHLCGGSRAHACPWRSCDYRSTSACLEAGSTTMNAACI
jgi:hypothetical protein